MPEKKTVERARRDARAGKAPTTQAGEFVREEIHHIREGKHGARSTKQAIAIGLSKARRAGVKLPARGRKERGLLPFSLTSGATGGSIFFPMNACQERNIYMRLSHLLVAGTALVSATAIAAGNQAKQGAQGDQQTQQSSQSAQGSQSQQQGSQQQASQGPEVIKQAQEKLSAQGHYAGQADGKLGPKTQAALKDFQQSKGLQASGQLDTQTLAALEIGGTQGSASTGSSASGSAGSGSSTGATGSSPERTAEPKAQEKSKY